MKILKRFFSKKNQPQVLINPDKIDWDKIDLEKIKFILEQSEKCLNAALNNTDSLDRKAFTVLGGSLSFASALIALILTKEFCLSNLLILILLIAGFVGSSIYSMFALETKTIELIGNKPMEMLKPKHSGYDQKYLICCEAQSNESKINKAIEVNSIKGKEINRAIKLIQSTLVIVIALFAITLL